MPAPPADVLITGALLMDGTGTAPYPADVLIRGERIAKIGRSLEAPGARVVAAPGHTLLPGLFDVHTHVRYATAGSAPGDWGKNLKAYLYCGVTSLADFGTYAETFEPMRRLIRTGAFEAPRVHFASRITTPGGHGAEGGRGDFYSLEVTTPREGRSAVLRVLPYRPDAIKVFTDGWRYGFSPDMTSMEESTLAAIVEEAHRHNLPVLTHTVTLERAKQAARAGVDVVAHGIGDLPVDDELATLMKKSGTFYAPTLAVYESKTRTGAPDLVRAVLEPAAMKSLAGSSESRPSPARTRRWKNLTGNTAALHAGGVAFAVGTDAGMTGTHHGYAALREMELLVQGGLSPLEALTAATGSSARALRVSDRGVIAEGKLADLVLVEGEPHRRIQDVYQVRRVFLGGREIDREKLRREIAAPGQTPVPATTAPEKLDDFESAGGRSSIDTLWVNSTDSGHDHTRMSFARTLRGPGNHVLTVLARMADKDRPFARVHLPLTPGAIVPVDATPFRGVAFETRGEGEYRVSVASRTLRSSYQPGCTFHAGPEWSEVRIPWSELRHERESSAASWSPKQLTELWFEISRRAGEGAWLELDNVRFLR